MHELRSSNFIQVVYNIEYMLKKENLEIRALHNKDITPKPSQTFDEY
jgi:hypothetical protein